MLVVVVDVVAVVVVDVVVVFSVLCVVFSFFGSGDVDGEDAPPSGRTSTGKRPRSDISGEQWWPIRVSLFLCSLDFLSFYHFFLLHIVVLTGSLLYRVQSITFYA